MISAVGNDELGDELLKQFEYKNLPCLIERVPNPTGTVLVGFDEQGIP